MGKGIVLGRFQPFHNGHEHLVLEALEVFKEVTIAIGSAQEEWTTDNDMLTPSMKVKLRNLLKKHDEEIQAIG